MGLIFLLLQLTEEKHHCVSSKTWMILLRPKNVSAPSKTRGTSRFGVRLPKLR